jgi:hypothetical protein
VQANQKDCLKPTEQHSERFELQRWLWTPLEHTLEVQTAQVLDNSTRVTGETAYNKA